MKEEKSLSNRKEEFLRNMQERGLMRASERENTRRAAAMPPGTEPEDEKFAFAMALNLDARLLPKDALVGAPRFAARLRGKFAFG